MVAACAMVVTLGAGTPALAAPVDGAARVRRDGDPHGRPACPRLALAGRHPDLDLAHPHPARGRAPRGRGRCPRPRRRRPLARPAVGVRPGRRRCPRRPVRRLVGARGHGCRAPARPGRPPWTPSPARRARSGGRRPAARRVPGRRRPGRPGPYRTVTGEYSLAGVTIAGLPEKVEVKAVVVSPRGTTGTAPPRAVPARPPRDLLPGATSRRCDWPCPAGFKPLPSYRGYLETQQLLASQGYDTVSISANGINAPGLDARRRRRRGAVGARPPPPRALAAVVEVATAHAAAPAVVKAAPRADLSRVLLVGHSRGGEGVNRAALDSTTGAASLDHQGHRPHRSDGLRAEPGARRPRRRPPALLRRRRVRPAGAGLRRRGPRRRQGPGAAERRPVFGADHNFFNEEWTPGAAVAPAFDDWGDDTDRVCGNRAGSTRLTPAAQRQVGDDLRRRRGGRLRRR